MDGTYNHKFCPGDTVRFKMGKSLDNYYIASRDCSSSAVEYVKIQWKR